MSEPLLVMHVDTPEARRRRALTVAAATAVFDYAEQSLAHAIAFYDQSRANGSTEACARVRAEIDLRIRVPELDSIGAAIVLADALARRATAKIGGI